MTAWIDTPVWPRHGTTFAHLVSDSSVEELHAVARAANLHPRSFDGDHYDVPAERWHDAVAAGAIATTGSDLARRLVASGLRLRKRRGDRGLTRVRGVNTRGRWGGVVDVDIVASPEPIDPATVAAVVCLLFDRDDRVGVVWAPSMDEWSNPGGGREPGETVLEAMTRELQEETGLTDVPVEPVGYERFTGTSTFTMQAFVGRVPEPQPSLRAEHSHLPAPRWLAWPQYEQLCGHQFWWPLAEHVAGVRRHYGRLAGQEAMT